jgi:hypothetical protein
MPFTVSHVAAVLPGYQLLRRWRLISAAMIGSMVPDFGFLLPWHVSRTQSHSALALLKFCLPFGLVAWILFQILVKPAWGAVLPDSWRLRLLAEHPTARLGRWQVWVAAGCAIVAGAVTHLIWDGFTHEDGRGVRMLPFLEDSGPDLAGHVLPLYRWLQHSCSVLGLAVVIWAAWRWTRGAEKFGQRPSAPDAPLITLLSRRERYAWLAAYVLPPAGVLGLAVVWHLRHLPAVFSVSVQLTRLAYIGMGASITTLLLVSALIHMRIAALARARLDA